MGLILFVLLSLNMWRHGKRCPASVSSLVIGKSTYDSPSFKRTKKVILFYWDRQCWDHSLVLQVVRATVHIGLKFLCPADLEKYRIYILLTINLKNIGAELFQKCFVLKIIIIQNAINNTKRLFCYWLIQMFILHVEEIVLTQFFLHRFWITILTEWNII